MVTDHWHWNPVSQNNTWSIAHVAWSVENHLISRIDQCTASQIQCLAHPDSDEYFGNLIIGNPEKGLNILSNGFSQTREPQVGSIGGVSLFQ